MTKLLRYLFGSIDCMIVLPLAFFISFVITSMPPAFTIQLVHFLQKITSCMPQACDNQNRSYRRWATALRRIRRYLKLKLTCLGEAIVLQAILRFSGVVSEIKVGIAREGDPKVAHAWLEIPGVEIEQKGDFIEFSVQPFHW